MKRNFPLHIHISTLFLALIILVGALIGGIGFTLSRDMLSSAADDLMQRISREMLGELERATAPAEMAVHLLGHSTVVEADTHTERMKSLPLLREVIEQSPTLSSIYVGYESGDFFFLRIVRDDAERKLFNAPAGTRYIVQSIEQQGAAAMGRHVFLDQSLATLRDDPRPDYAASYDPRTRRWYQDAAASRSLIRTAPYLFFSNRKVGTTLAAKSGRADAVIGADILLATLGSSLARQKVTPGSQIVLVSPEGEVIAHEDAARLITVPEGDGAKPRLARLDQLGVPVLAHMATRLRNQPPGVTPNAERVSVAGDAWHVNVQPVKAEGTAPLLLVTAIPDKELFAAAIRLRTTSLAIMLIVILIAAPLTWLAARAIVKPLQSLVDEAEAIRRFDFSRKFEIKSRVTEVAELATTMDAMKRSTQRFLDVSQAMASEESFDRLLPMLLKETLAAAEGAAGVLYLADNEGLIPVAALQQDGTDLMGTLLPVALDQPGPLLRQALAEQRPLSAVLDDDDLACLGVEDLIDAHGARHGIAVPLLNRDHQLIGVMLLLRHAPADDAQVAFVKALAGSAGTALETRELIKAQRDLFEAFIQLIAGAIDAKSPYTGGHCARVPELTKMLARAACAETDGPFKDFALQEQDWEAVHVASWLHDCGKVTTPEYVVDKATKLETLCDRIHEVRMRFEVLKRDAEIACLQSIVAGGEESSARAALREQLATLDEEFGVVATCNEGGEFMAPDKVARIRQIASRTWTRTLDDRIGISHEEKERKARTPAAPLPATEPLLADKPEHLFERRPQDRMPDDNKWGFRLNVPELLYNKGEVYNLIVSRGTLSEEERYKINEHIVQTLIMLSQLPFPKHLRGVAEIAGGHHEKMDGTGYPKRLTREQMSPVARMMAIADIFEALTAVDRPYKKGKTLSEAVKIMSFMKKDQHIDPDLFDLFLRSGVYREYAAQFMKPEQIDNVDVDTYLTKPVAA